MTCRNTTQIIRITRYSNQWSRVENGFYLNDQDRCFFERKCNVICNLVKVSLEWFDHSFLKSSKVRARGGRRMKCHLIWFIDVSFTILCWCFSWLNNFRSSSSWFAPMKLVPLLEKTSMACLSALWTSWKCWELHPWSGLRPPLSGPPLLPYKQMLRHKPLRFYYFCMILHECVLAHKNLCNWMTLKVWPDV